MKRFDNIKLIFGKNVEETEQGFLKIPAYTARTGVQSYRRKDGRVVKEFRPESEVFSEISMKTLSTAVVTNEHPKEMVTPENVHKYQVGYPFGGVEKIDDGEGFEKYLKTHLIVTHQDAIAEIRKGKAELSNGYAVDLEMTSGEHNGEKYDAIQKNIRNNHIAIVYRGRAGNSCRLRLDADDGIYVDENDKPIKEKPTMKIDIGGKEFEVEDELGKAIKSNQKRSKKENDDAIADLNKAKEEKTDALDGLEVAKSAKSRLLAKCDSLESDLEKAKGQRMDAAQLDEAVQARINVFDSAKKILSEKEVEGLSKMDNAEIKKAIIKADSPKVDESRLDDESYVSARYDMIVEKFDASNDSKTGLGNKIIVEQKNKTDKSEYKTPAQIRKDNMQAAKDASLAPINAEK